MAVRLSGKDPNERIQTGYDQLFDDLKKAESAGTVDKDKQSDDINAAENNPSGGWQTNVTGAAPTKSTGLGKFGFLKKKGPMAMIVGLLITAAGGISFIGNPAFLTQSILANLVQKFNTQETSFAIRTDKMIAKKLAGKATSGVCVEPFTIYCRFTRPSNRFLTKLEQSGIKLLDSNNDPIEKRTLFLNKRPAKYRYTNAIGEEIEINASQLTKELSNNPEFRAAFRRASNSRFASLTDSVFDFIKAKFKFNLTDKFTKTTDEEALGKKVNEEVKVDDSRIKSAVNSGDEAVEQVARDIVEEEADRSIKKLERVGKGGGGNAAGLVAAGVCFVTDVPGLIAKANRAFQMSQLIKYSSTFLSAFGAIKAGDATAAEVSAIGNQLTKVVDGKSAMDSYGMKYAINGQVKPPNNNYQDFIPGLKLSQKLNPITKVTNSEVRTDTCKVMTNPATGEVINVALAANAGESLGTTLVVAGVNIVVGYALTEVMDKVLPPVLNAILSKVDMEKVLTFFFGGMTENLEGEKIGDALTSGAAHVMGQTANAGGNMPLTPDEALAYDNTTKQLQLAYAEEDRATKSPFDISSPYTFAGNIVQRLLPYYASSSSTISSLSSNLSVLGNIITGSFTNMLKPATSFAATTDASEYKMCEDSELEGAAAGPFCNIIYGIPTEYLNEDPMTVLNDLAGKDVDENSGEPIKDSKYKIWLEMCTDGSSDGAKYCMIDDKKKAEYAIYTIDHRVQEALDGSYTYPTTTTETTTETEAQGQ